MLTKSRVTILAGCLAIVLVFVVLQRELLENVPVNGLSKQQTEIESFTIPSNFIYDALKNILDCKDKPLVSSVDSSGKYIILRNFIRAEFQYKCHQSVTITTVGDFRYFNNIVPMIERWMAPISVAVYAPGYDFHSTLKSIAYLRNCNGDLVKQLVTFHLFFEHEHVPDQNGNEPLVNSYKDIHNCNEAPPYNNVSKTVMYKTKNNLTFPINVARNIAAREAQTHFIFPVDIELYPSRNFTLKFLIFVLENPQYFRKNTKNVFPLPVLEILENQMLPETKREAQQMLRNKTGFWFHEKICAPCHMIPAYEKWSNSEEHTKLSVHAVAKRNGEFQFWEPFFVCTQNDPLWDERINWEGQRDKFGQAVHLCKLEYDFVILDNAFLVHKPGVKKTGATNAYLEEEAKNLEKYNELKRELDKIYGNKIQC